MTQRFGRRFRGFGSAFLAAVAIAAASGAASVAPAAAATTPTVTVTPSTNLVDLQQVTLKGSGFTPNIEVASAQCKPGATGEADCDLSGVVYDDTDANGAFTQTRYVRRIITVAGTKVDCAAAAGCTIGAGNVADLSEHGGQQIFFDPTVPPQTPGVTVTPHTNLVDHQLVQISGHGFAPNGEVEVLQCAVHPPAGAFDACDYSTGRYLGVGDDGRFSAPNFALERRLVAFTRTGDVTIDCAAAPGTCDIAVDDFDSNSVTTPLSFNPSAPLAVASVHVSPVTGLHDLQTITVTGTGFTPGVPVNVEQCANNDDPFSACDYTNSRAVTAGFHGEFALSFAVHRHVAAYEYLNGVIDTDCAAHANTCELVVTGTASQPNKTIGLSFNPHAASATRSIFVGRDRNLYDNESLNVRVQGFTPNSTVQIVQCAADAIEEGGDLQYCDNVSQRIVGTDDRGSASLNFSVHRAIAGNSGLIDCTARAGACVLVAQQVEDYYYGGGVVVGGESSGTTATTTAPAAGSAAFRATGRASAALKAAPGSDLPNLAYVRLSFAT